MLQTMQFCTWRCVKCDVRAASVVPGLCRGAVLVVHRALSLGFELVLGLTFTLRKDPSLGKVYSGVTECYWMSSESVHLQIKNYCVALSRQFVLMTGLGLHALW